MGFAVSCYVTVFLFRTVLFDGGICFTYSVKVKKEIWAGFCYEISIMFGSKIMFFL